MPRQIDIDSIIDKEIADIEEGLLYEEDMQINKIHIDK